MKSIRSICIVSFVVFILMLDSSAKPKKKSLFQTGLIEYYSTIPLRESPYPDFIGVVRLLREEALTRNHYRFEYDEQFRLISVSFRLGNTLRNPNHTANYFFTTPVQKFEYQDKKEIRTFFDRFGNQTSQRGAYREIYTLNQKGKRIGLHFEDKDGNKIENRWGILNYKWEHQKDGSVIENRYNLKGESKSLRPQFEFHTIRLYYEQNGILALMQNIDSKGSLLENSSGVAQDKLLFDEEGRWTGWNVLDKNHQPKKGNGPNVAKGINIPDRYGYEISIRYEDVDGTPLINSHGFWGGKRFYDIFGNYKMEYFIDSLGKPGINLKTGYCYAKYTWDKTGLNRLKVQLLDTRHKPVLHKLAGFVVIKHEYNGDNNLVKTSYLGLKGEKINRRDNGTSYIIYTYKDDKSRAEIKRYSKKGELLN